MTIPVALHLVPLAGFAGLMATAAFEDLRRLIIPNGLILGLCVLWPLYVATAPMLTLAAAGTGALYAAATQIGLREAQIHALRAVLIQGTGREERRP
jgi:Flp pilus assembly protein protease CpaA